MAANSWSKSKVEIFNVTFQGDAVKNFEIDANDLATSLMGITEVIEEANKIIYGEEFSEAYVKVKSDFKPGSFWVTLALVLTSTNFESVINLISLLGFCGVDLNSLIQFVKRTKGRKIINETKISGDQYQITVENGSQIFLINEATLKLAKNKKIRKGMSTLVKAFENPGISEIQFSSQDNPEIETIRREDAEFFKAPEKEIEDEKTDVDIFLITRPDFRGRQKGWRCSFGYTDDDEIVHDFPVTITDKEFLDKVRRGQIIISQGTKIKAKYKKTISELEKLSVSWEIMEVISIEPLNRRDADLLQFF